MFNDWNEQEIITDCVRQGLKTIRNRILHYIEVFVGSRQLSLCTGYRELSTFNMFPLTLRGMKRAFI